MVNLTTEENTNIIVKNSKIHGKGVFANKNFKKGYVVLRYNPIQINDEDFKKLSDKEKESIFVKNGNHMRHTSPAIYVNHSCNPNTNPSDNSDIAIKNIKKGEEITSDYSIDSPSINMKCNCKSKNCRGLIK